MTSTDLLTQLKQAGCEVWLDGDTLRVRGPLTDNLRAAIKENKPTLVALLREQALDAQAQEISKIFHEKGWVAFSSRLLNGEEVVFVKDAKVAIPIRWRDAIKYTLAELEVLTAPPLPDREGLKAIHEVKKLFNGKIVTRKEAQNDD